MITPRHALLPFVTGSVLLVIVGAERDAPRPAARRDSALRAPQQSQRPRQDTGAGCCRRTEPQGLADLLKAADEMFWGAIPELPGQSAPEQTVVEVRADEVFLGPATGLDTRAISFDGLDPHARPGTRGLWVIQRDGQRQVPLAVVGLESSDRPLIRSAIKALMAVDRARPETRTKAGAAITELVLGGSRNARQLAGLDLVDDAALTASLDDAAMTRLCAAIPGISDTDRSLADLHAVLACRPDATKSLGVLLSSLERPRFDKLFEVYVRALRRDTTPGLFAALAERLDPERPEVVRRRAAALIARSDDERRLDLLAAFLDNREDKELQAAALIGFAGVTRHAGVARARSLALDALRSHLLPRPRRAPVGPAAERVAERHRDELRANGGSEETLRLMAAGHLLVRLQDPALRKALEGWLPRLDDSAVEGFIRTRRAEAWSEFDGAW